MKTINLILPNQLYKYSPLLENGHEIYLIEEYLYFQHYQFHKQKIAFHRASMKAYQFYLEGLGKKVKYIDSENTISDIRNLTKEIEEKGIEEIHMIDLTDFWLEKRLSKLTSKCKLKVYPDQQFLNTKQELYPFFRSDKKSFFQTSFYKQQRKKRNILVDDKQQPQGGKWTFDADNRKKYPKDKHPPKVYFPSPSPFWTEAIAYVYKNFSENPGEVSRNPTYPITHDEAQAWFDQFLMSRFFDFGIYEDAIVEENSILNHSLLSPLMNTGLLLPAHVVKEALNYATENTIPINSTEGFVRQIIGWREFIRGMYVCKGNFSRTQNFWKFNRKIPSSFYDGTTGVLPIDQTIQKVLKTGYCNHIERLMVLGNFMLLCEFNPNEVYKWFMELFIDAYDWVMVPNVYGMCLFADGGTFATKPYIGGSNYLKKMGNYPKGEWEQVWDGMFWRFVVQHQDFFRTNPRTSMLIHSLNKMPIQKRENHMQNADAFIDQVLIVK